MRFGPVRILLLTMVLLAGGLAWLWVDQTGKVRNVSWAAPAPMAAGIATKASAPAAASFAANPAQFLAVLERPVFAPDRRPPPPPAPPTPPPPPDPMANIQIRGVFSGATPGIIVNVEGKLQRVKVSETIGAWTLKSVEGRDVTFVQGSESRQLRLAFANLATVAPVKSPAGQAAAAPQQAGQPFDATAFRQKLQDEAREILRRRNQTRAERGLPLLTE